MANQSAKGWKRIRNAVIFSTAGFKATWQHEEAFRQEVMLFIFACPFAIFFAKTAIEIVLLLGSLVLVLLVELLNSAIEAAIDRIGFEHHELSERAKDIGSAAVMLALIGSFVTWFAILVF